MIVAALSLASRGRTTRPCAGLGSDQPAPIKVIKSVDGAYESGINICVGDNEIVTVVVDRAALFVSRNTGCPTSTLNGGKISDRNPRLFFKTTVVSGTYAEKRISARDPWGRCGVVTEGSVADIRDELATF